MPTELDTSFWFLVHLSCAIGADLLMLLAGLLALIYLWQDWRLRSKKLGCPLELPSIHTLDDWGVRLLTTAFILMTGGMIAGSVMARQLWGAYWYLDARQVWSVLVWILFAAVLIARFFAGWRGRKASIISVAGVLFMLVGHLSLGAMTRTRHRVPYSGSSSGGEVHHDG